VQVGAVFVVQIVGLMLSGCGLSDEGKALFNPPPGPASSSGSTPAPTSSPNEPPGPGGSGPGSGTPDAGSTATQDSGGTQGDAGSPGNPSPGDAGGGPETGQSAPPPAPPTVLAQDFGAGEFVTVESGHAYWTTGTGNTILSCPVTGCAANVATLGSGMTTYGITVDTANVYWTDYGDGLACECPLAGCDGTTILEGQGYKGDGIAVAFDSIFWTFETDETGAAGTGAVFMSATDGTGTTPLVTGQNYPTGLVAGQNGDLYWTVYGDGTVRSCSWMNCAATVKDIVTGMNGPSYLAVDGAHIYWTNAGTAPDYGNGTVMQANLDGTSPIVLASSMAYPRGIAVDATSVYFTNYVAPDTITGTVMKCAIGGCGSAPTTLATGQASPVGVAVDGTSVYWLDEGGGGLLMMTAK
jgi:hypothetical protein